MNVARFLRTTRLYYTQAVSVELVYRFALAQSFVGTAIGFVGLVLFWLAAGRAATATGATGYGAGTIIAYFLYSSAHAIIQENRLSWNLSAGIRMGKLAASLLRPYPFLGSTFAQAAAHATIRVLIIAPLFVALFLAVDVLREVGGGITLARLGGYAAAMVVSLAAGWLIKLLLGLLAFDMTQTWGPELIFYSLFAVGSGIGYPPDLLPQAVLAVVKWTPVYYMIGFPSLVLLGRVSGDALLQELAQGTVVSLLTALIVYAMWRRGMKKFEAVGI